MIVDAMGLACPEPVIRTKKALSSKPDTLTVLVDNVAAKENVTRFAEHAGYSVEAVSEGEKHTLNLSKK
jgi:Predicted redox protein, regulator of disulfide bond formation